MEKEALQVQIGLLKRFTKIALDIENKGLNLCTGDDLFFVNENISLLKVLLGEGNASYKQMVSLEEIINLKIAANEEPLIYM